MASKTYQEVIMANRVFHAVATLYDEDAPRVASRRARASRKTTKKRAKRKAKLDLFGGRLPW